MIIFVEYDLLLILFYNIPMLWGWRFALHAQRRTRILALSMSLHVVATSPDGHVDAFTTSDHVVVLF